MCVFLHWEFEKSRDIHTQKRKSCIPSSTVHDWMQLDTEINDPEFGGLRQLPPIMCFLDILIILKQDVLWLQIGVDEVEAVENCRVGVEQCDKKQGHFKVWREAMVTD